MKKCGWTVLLALVLGIFLTGNGLWAQGILGKRFLDIQSEILNSKIPKEYTHKLLALIRDYASNGEYLDENYISKLYKIVADLKDILKLL